jgi:hypothetical protein
MTSPGRNPMKGKSGIPSGGRSPFNWRNLFEPFRPRREGTMPAGLIIVVIVLALCVAGLFDADSTLRKSNAKGDGWRNEIAKTVASVTVTLHINFFRNSLPFPPTFQGPKSSSFDCNTIPDHTFLNGIIDFSFLFQTKHHNS